MTATARQLDLLGKLDRWSIALEVAVTLPDSKYLGVCQAIARMNEELRDIAAALRTDLDRPKAQPKPIKGGIETVKGND